MTENQDKIEQLLEKLTGLIKKQELFQREIEELRGDIHLLRSQQTKPEPETIKIEKPEDHPIFYQPQQKKAEEEPVIQKDEPLVQRVQSANATTNLEEDDEKPFNIEKFIGENLISKIGIAITVIGVGIGAKYAIDNQLISPLTRIILGYLLGLGLFLFALRLKKEYGNFSAVLLSGSMAIFYFITFAAFSFYALMPLAITFSLMVLFTIFTVASAISYNRQVIAHIGLVGAYAVPFLLSEGSGKVVILFSYMAIINAGILVIAFRKYWKPLYYSSFLITWLIFLSWFIPKFEATIHFESSWIFISIYFVTFYIIFLAYKLLKKEKFDIDDILLMIVNSSVFYGVGYSILNQQIGGEDFQGLFTLGNAFIYTVAGILIFRQNQVDKNLFFFTAGLALAFFTIAIPVQLDGNWVTLLWVAESAILFWIGRTKNTATYELLSYALMILAFFSIVLSWPGSYHVIGSIQNSKHFIPLLNVNFLTSTLFIASFVFINILNSDKQFTSPLYNHRELLLIMNFIMPAILLFVLYLSFYQEISHFWNQLFIDSTIPLHNGPVGINQYTNDNINDYNTLSILVYSLLFFSILTFVNIRKIKNSLLGFINLGLGSITIGLYLILGLLTLSALRESYMSQTLAEYYYRGIFTIGIRYISYIFVALMLFALYKYHRQESLETDLHKEFDLIFHITVLTIASSELINWMDLLHSEQSYKLGLSILFGVYSLLLIVLGIWKQKFHLRVGAIVLFSVTLLKLFFYDLTSLDTISKTIVFVVLGLLLLVISFLYNKYKHVIFDEKA